MFQNLQEFILKLANFPFSSPGYELFTVTVSKLFSAHCLTKKTGASEILSWKKFSFGKLHSSSADEIILPSTKFLIGSPRIRASLYSLVEISKAQFTHIPLLLGGGYDPLTPQYLRQECQSLYLNALSAVGSSRKCFFSCSFFYIIE